MTDAEPKGIAEIRAVATVLRGARSKIESKVIISIDDSKIKVIKSTEGDKDSDRSPSTGTSNHKESD